MRAASLHYGRAHQIRAVWTGDRFAQKAGVDYVELSGVKPNPRSLVREGIRLPRARLEFHIGGGRRQRDRLGKAIALGAVDNGDVWTFEGLREATAALPVGVVHHSRRAANPAPGP